MIKSQFKIFTSLPRILIFSLIWLFSQNATAEAIVVTHPQVAIESISSQTLGRIYAMQVKSWPDGKPIKVFTLAPKNAEHRQFVISKIKMQPHQLERLWNRLIFTGTGRTPTIVNSSKEMIQKVKNTPGAIGYIVNPVDLSGVKVIEVGQ